MSNSANQLDSPNLSNESDAKLTRRDSLKALGIGAGAVTAYFVAGKPFLRAVMAFNESGKIESQLSKSPSAIKAEIENGQVDPAQLSMVHAPEAESVDQLTGQITANSGESQTLNQMAAAQEGSQLVGKGDGIIVPTKDIASNSIFANPSK